MSYPISSETIITFLFFPKNYTFNFKLTNNNKTHHIKQGLCRISKPKIRVRKIRKIKGRILHFISR